LTFSTFSGFLSIITVAIFNRLFRFRFRFWLRLFPWLSSDRMYHLSCQKVQNIFYFLLFLFLTIGFSL